MTWCFLSFAANFLDCESNRYLLPVVQKIAPRAILGPGSSDNNDKCRNDLLPPSPRYGKYGKLKMAPLPCSNIIWTLTMNAPILIPVSSPWRDYIWRHKLDWRRLPWHFFWIYFSISSLQLLCVMISHWSTVLKHKMPSQILIKTAGLVL